MTHFITKSNIKKLHNFSDIKKDIHLIPNAYLFILVKLINLLHFYLTTMLTSLPGTAITFTTALPSISSLVLSLLRAISSNSF